MKKILIIITVFLAFNAHASFVSEFVKDLEQNLAGDYFESQGRGYATFGSYSTRSKNVVINPVSIAPPSINIGCNGIDIVGGGISFLGEQDLKRLYDQLVNPNTLMYVGTSMAMKMLSNELAGSVETAMDMIQQINAMQLDGCGIANAGISYMTDSSYRAATSMKMNRAVDTVSDFANNNVIRAVKKQESSSSSDIAERKTNTASKLANFSGKEYFINGGSLLEYILEQWASAEATTEPFAFPSNANVSQLRALYGDIYYDVDNRETIRMIAPCDLKLDDLEEAYYSRGATAGATCVRDNTDSISTFTGKGLDNLIGAYMGEADIDPEFINAVQGTNILLVIKGDSGRDAAYLRNSIQMLKPIAATELAYKHTDVYYLNLIRQLEVFNEEAKSFGGEYGTTLEGSINRLIRDAKVRHQLFESQKQYMVRLLNEFLATRDMLQDLPAHKDNTLYKTLEGTK